MNPVEMCPSTDISMRDTEKNAIDCDWWMAIFFLGEKRCSIFARVEQSCPIGKN